MSKRLLGNRGKNSSILDRGIIEIFRTQNKLQYRFYRRPDGAHSYLCAHGDKEKSYRTTNELDLTGYSVASHLTKQAMKYHGD